MRTVRHLQRLGFPLPERQYTVRDERGRFVARVDLGWSPWKIGLEYDGARYHGPRRWAADDERQGRMEALRWQIARVSQHDLDEDLAALEAWLTARLPRFPPGKAA